MFIKVWLIYLYEHLWLKDARTATKINTPLIDIEHHFLLANISQLENDLGVKFADRSLLLKAVTHASYASENKDLLSDNERLEFLGDAVLDAAISYLIFDKYPNVNEGDLTVIRSNIVNGNSLADSAKRFGLGNYLLLGKGEEKGGGRAKVSILSSALEALFGAIFIDKGFDVTCSVISKLLEYDINNDTQGSMKDPKTKLQEIIQSKIGQVPKYKVISQIGEGQSSFFVSEVIINGEEYAKGEGPSKLISEMEAAEKALFKIKDTAI